MGVVVKMRKGESKIVTVAAVMVIIALVIVGVIYLQNKNVADNLSQLRFNEVYRQLSGH
jgi:archaellum component FlaF (FlaF/FlaG flagellin family)